MAILNQLMDQFKSFWGGPKLVDGGELRLMAESLFSTRNSIVARAGGLEPLATQLAATFNTVSTVASAADSVRFPLAIPGAQCTIFNNGANSLRIFAKTYDPNLTTPSDGDKVIAQGAVIAAAAASIDQASGLMVTYVCISKGYWKQGSIS